MHEGQLKLEIVCISCHKNSMLQENGRDGEGGWGSLIWPCVHSLAVFITLG